MKVIDLLPKLVKNECYQIAIADENNNNIITFNPSGYIGLSDEINNREINEIEIHDSIKIIKIFLVPVADNGEPDPIGG